MRKKSFRTLFAGLCFALLVPLSAFADVEINEQNFPDANFRAYLLAQDYGQDGVITDDEIAGITEIDVYNREISTLEGIQHFTALTTLFCDYNQLTSLDVSGCTALTELECQWNKLTSLDVSGCTALTDLDCSYNKLTELNASGCTALTELRCYNNQLTSLNASGCTALTYLSCYYNQLTSLNASGCTALTSLGCSNNQLTELDVSGCTALTSLGCSNNQLTELDVSGCTALTTLNCSYNQISGENMDKLIESLPNSSGVISMYDSTSDKEGNDGCTDEQVRIMRGKGWTPYYYSESGIWEPYFGDEEGLRINEQNFPDAKFREYLFRQSYGKDGVITDEEIAEIYSIYVSKNSYTADKDKISTLEGIKHFTALTYLNCDWNLLTSLDLSNNTALRNLYCSFNQLTSLNASGCTALTELECYYNQLTSLDVSNCTALTFLNCRNNQLTSLDVSGCTALTYLGCWNNKIYGEEMDKFIESLREYDGTPGFITGIIRIIYSNSDTEDNICTWNQADAIKAKGWKVDAYWSTTYNGLKEWNVEMHEGQGEYWATLYAPFGYTLPEGTEAYVGTLNEDKQTLKMTSIGREVPRGVPVVIKGNNANVVAAVDDEITAEVGDNDLVGMYEPFDATDTDVYTLGIYEKIVGFYKDKGTTERFKAVLELPEGIAANGYRMVFEDDDITAIEEANAIVDNANVVYYDLQGRRVAEPQKGQLYIVNGKTVLYQP